MGEERKNTKAGLLLLDAGNLFFGGSKGKCDKKTMENGDGILESYQAMRYGAINLSQNDLLLGVPHLQKKGKDLNLPFLSSNLVEKGNRNPLFDPFVVKKTNGLMVGILGLMDQPDDRQESISFLIKDPYKAAEEILESLKGRADLIVVLSSLSRGKNIRLLEKFLDIDFVIGTDKPAHAPVPVKRGYILSSGSKGKYLGRLDIALTSLRKPLALKDMNAERRLKSNLISTERKIAQLTQEKGDILNSGNASIKERFQRELQRLKETEEQYRKELAKSGDDGNYFENRRIPLSPKPSEKRVRRSQQDKRKARRPLHPASPGPHIKISSIPDDKAKRVTYVLLIEKAPNRVSSLGLDVYYNPEALKYSGHTKGSVVNDFDMFGVNRLKNGMLRVGGFDAGKDFIHPGKGGVIVRLNFQVIGKGNLNLNLGGLKDDISSWKVEGQK